MSTNPKYDLVPIVSIFAKLTRDLGLQTVDEADVIEWTGEALQAIGSVPMYEDAVAFMEVRNHQVYLPNGALMVDQIARNKCWAGPEANPLCPADLLNDINSTINVQECLDANNPCKNPLPIPLDCKGQPLNDYSIAYYRPYYDLLSEYYGWSWNASRLNQECFIPVRLTTNTFFLAQQDYQHNHGLNNQQIYHPGASWQDEYIINRKLGIIRFSFKTGQVAIAYKRQAVDPETGYPLIPDTYAHRTAITKYITMMMQSREFYQGREGAKGRLDKAEQDWHWYCKQAGNLDLMPWGIDEHQNLYDQRTRLLPNNKQYFSFFGKMNVPEGRKWDDPDHRNYAVNFFRGAKGYAF
jgi:hypothetical protein